MISPFESTYRVIGLMSGTSLDGLDICEVEFYESFHWEYRIGKTGEYQYSEGLRKRLLSAHLAPEEELNDLGKSLGEFYAQCLLDFQPHPDTMLIASHGHTVHHQPEIGCTLQIGDVAPIISQLNLPVVYDFRTQDVRLGGQGAPLVPVGDELLFDQYRYCVNLGGFSNYSFTRSGMRRAGDICAVNVVLNQLANELGEPYDPEGQLAASGSIDHLLLKNLNQIPFYQLPTPKSLGREWVDKNVWPLLNASGISIVDKLRTYSEHAAIQIGQLIDGGNALVTGGGAHNSFLMDLIRNRSNATWVVPDPKLVDFKEALIFGFLGLLRMLDRNNVLASVTGAPCDHCAGQVAMPE